MTETQNVPHPVMDDVSRAFDRIMEEGRAHGTAAVELAFDEAAEAHGDDPEALRHLRHVREEYREALGHITKGMIGLREAGCEDVRERVAAVVDKVCGRDRRTAPR